MSDSITGNPTRDSYISAAIIRAPNGDTTLATIQAALPPDFDLGEDELAAMLAAMKIEPAAPAAVANAEPSAVAEPPAPSREAAEAAQARVHEVQNALARARADVMALSQKQRQARAALASAIQHFSSGLPQWTPEMNVRAHIASANAERADRKAGRLAPRQGSRPGPSFIDRQAFYGAGGDANDFVRKNMRGGGYRRGALPGSMRGRRLPSER